MIYFREIIAWMLILVIYLVFWIWFQKSHINNQNYLCGCLSVIYPHWVKKNSLHRCTFSNQSTTKIEAVPKVACLVIRCHPEPDSGLSVDHNVLIIKPNKFIPAGRLEFVLTGSAGMLTFETSSCFNENNYSVCISPKTVTPIRFSNAFHSNGLASGLNQSFQTSLTRSL
jgi:hypothetical protein